MFYTSQDEQFIGYDCQGNTRVRDALMEMGGTEITIPVWRHVPSKSRPGWTDHIPDSVLVVALAASQREAARQVIEAILRPPQIVSLPRETLAATIFAFHRTPPPIASGPLLILPDETREWVMDSQGNITLPGITVLYNSMRVFVQDGRHVRHGNLVFSGMFPPGTRPAWSNGTARILPLETWDTFQSRWYEARVADAWHG